MASRGLNAWLFEAHPYGHPVEGREGVIPLLEVEDLRRFHAEHYLRASVVIGIAGAATPEQALALVDRMEALGTSIPPHLALMQPRPVHGRSLLFLETGTDVVGFRMGHPVDFGRSHPDYPALYLAFTAFGAHRQSFGTLFRSLRGARGLNYGTYAYAEPFRERRGAAMPEQGVVRSQSFTHLWIRPTAAQNAAFALKLALAELEDLVEEGLSEEVFDDTKAYVEGSLALLAQDPGRRLAYALEAEAAGLPDPLRTLGVAIDRLTRGDVSAALKRHIHPADLRIVAVGGGGDVLREQLLRDEPTPITYAEGLVPSDQQAERDAIVAAMDLGLDPASATVRSVDGLFR